MLSEAWKGNSIARAFLNLKLREERIHGDVLDLGGGESAHSSIMERTNDGSVVTLDIRSHAGPTVVANVEFGLPFGNATFDTVLLFNVLEHVFNYEAVLREVSRVLRAQGVLHAYVPFMYHRHTAEHPEFYVDDYFRYGPTAIARILSERAGFSGPIRVETVDLGPFSSAANTVAMAMPGRRARAGVFAAGLFFDALYSRLRPPPNPKSLSEWPVGVWVTATR